MKAAAAFVLLAAGLAEAGIVDRLNTPTLRPLGTVFANSVGKSLPVPAASSGITFTFNPQTSAFERETDITGQLYLERARPIGRGKLDASVSYQWVKIDTLDGAALGDLRDTDPILDPVSGHRFVVPRLSIVLVTNVVTTSLTYGVTDDLEVNLTVPVLQSHADVSARLRDLTDGNVQGGASDESAAGFGDLFLRGKYRLLHGRAGDVAAGLVFRLPSGRVEDLQGTGFFELSPMLYASTRAFEVAPGMRVQGYVNAGLDLVPQDASRGEGRWGVGVDVLFLERATLGVAFLGREPFARLVPPGTFDVPRANGGRSPIFGIDPGQPSYYDVSVGLRVNLWRDTVFGVANVLVPANPDAGARASVIPLAGIEAVF